MKRKFILLPITLTALAPAISLVGCNDPEPTPTDEIIVDDFKFDPTISALSTTINLEVGQKYCFVIKVKDYLLTAWDVWFNMMFSTEQYIELYCLFGGISIEIDNVWLNNYGSKTPDLDIENGYFCPTYKEYEGKFNEVYWKYNQTKQNSIIKIHFISNEKLNNVLVVTFISEPGK